ncbi:MAG: hypothetical protein K9W45_11100 [Candidatus Heimdallarchaeum aukensis]|uniref:Uncharacterized protein n=1 Tax=Candidatus Heimdallarchaeum aukensis TaxID=2876573 RepID=A0A9Y1FKL5_9ARCH|nr:MAG: hypothetical protein K9W45_11100 [Candidatus Heimdallarchaeum aukensis]
MKISQKIQKRILVSGVIIFLMVTSFLIVVPVIANEDDDEDETDPPEDEEETEIETEEDHDEDDDGIDDEEEKINEREVEIEVSTHSAEIKSRREFGDTENEFKIELEVPSNSDGNDIEFKLEFSSDTSTQEIELEFKVKISNIVEYIDTDADGMYNESVDQLVQTYLFDNFLPIEYTTDNISGNLVHILNIETSDGVFTSRIYASGEFAIVNDSLITPVELKIDIGIHKFPYIEPNSALAMKVKIESEGEKEIDEETEDEERGHSSNEKEVEISMGDFTGFFS